MPRRHRDGDDQRKDDASDGPVEDGRADGGMPGPARVTAMRERGDAGEQIAVGETVTRDPGRGGPGHPQDTDENGADSHGTEKQIGRLGGVRAWGGSSHATSGPP